MPNLNVGLVVAFGVAMDANAIGACNQLVCDVTDSQYNNITSPNNCGMGTIIDNNLVTATCYAESRILSCANCPTGYSKKANTVAIPCSGGKTTWYTCVQDCTGCSDCTSDTSWSSAGTGYEKKVTRTCNCNTCNSSTSYRCAAGYYGSSTNGTSGCSKCTSHNSVSANSSAGSTAQTSCYISSSSSWSFSDTTGSGSAKFASNCYYSN